MYGVGNLIVGYNETRTSGNVRTDSHNVVVGTEQNYSSFGGLVVVRRNTISGQYSTVSGGWSNTASGSSCSVSGGYGNHAWSEYTAVLGGQGNYAGNPADATHLQGRLSTVSGGYDNDAFGNFASVPGGASNPAAVDYATNVGDATRIYSNSVVLH